MPTLVWGLIGSLGILVTAFLFLGFVANKVLMKQTRWQESIFLYYLTGFILYYLLLLLGLKLDYLLLLFKISSLSFLIFALVQGAKNRHTFNEKTRISTLLTLLFVGICFYLSEDILKMILFDPIKEWDARSLWYFKSKQLFYANGFNETTGLYNHPFSLEMQGEYPFFVPALGALIMKEAGFWNEYLPKANLLLLWVGIVLAFISLRNISLVNKIALLSAILYIYPLELTTGYIDAWLGVYVFLSLLFLIEFILSGKKEYLFTSITSWIMINYFKDDSNLVVISIIISFVIVAIVTRQVRFLNYTLARFNSSKYFLLVLLLPLAIWMGYKRMWHISSVVFDFSILTKPSTWETAFAKEKSDLIYDYMIRQGGYLTLFIACIASSILVVAYQVQNKSDLGTIKKGLFVTCFPLLACIVFFAGMWVLYCLSRLGLEWHLSTSADRLRMHLVFISLTSLYGSLYFLTTPFVYKKGIF